MLETLTLKYFPVTLQEIMPEWEMVELATLGKTVKLRLLLVLSEKI